MARVNVLQEYYNAQADAELQKLKELEAKANAKAKGEEKPKPVVNGFNPKNRTHNTLSSDYCDIFVRE